MQVRELIELLQRFDPGAEVRIRSRNKVVCRDWERPKYETHGIVDVEQKTPSVAIPVQLITDK